MANRKISFFRQLSNPHWLAVLALSVCDALSISIWAVNFSIWKIDVVEGICDCVFLVISLYLLYLLVAFLYRQYKKKVEPKVLSTETGRALFGTYGASNVFWSLVSLLINIGYAVLNIVLAVLLNSLWYGLIAIFYAVLMGARMTIIFLARHIARKYWMNKTELLYAELKVSIGSGGLIFLMYLSMAFAVTFMITNTPPNSSGKVVAIGLAAYTFYKIILAIVNLVRSRKNGDPVVTALRNISMADACMSLVNTTITLDMTFASGNLAIAKNLAAFLAVGVTLALSIYAIVKGIILLRSKTVLIEEDKFSDK